MVSPVNASRQPSRAAAHHSGPERPARPYSAVDFHLLSFASLSWRSPLVAKSRHPAAGNRLPLCPRKPTFSWPPLTSGFDPGCVKTQLPRPTAQQLNPEDHVDESLLRRRPNSRPNISSRSSENRFHTAWVNYGLSRPTAATSAFRGKADEISTITDIGPQRSVRRPAGQRLAMKMALSCGRDGVRWP